MIAIAIAITHVGWATVDTHGFIGREKESVIEHFECVMRDQCNLDQCGAKSCLVILTL